MRYVLHSATGPVDVTTPKGDVVSICRCGLTADPTGQCDKTHKILREKITAHPEDNHHPPCYDPQKRNHQNFPVKLNCSGSCADCNC